MSKLCPHLILEGTRLTHKTDLAFALNEHPRIVGPRKYRYHSPLISAEWCGFTNTPWGRGLINYAPDEAERARETYETWVRLFELMPHYSWIIDRFHLSTQVYQQRAYGVAPDFVALETRLARLNFRIILCVRAAETFAAARTARLKISGNPRQYDDLSAFLAEQDALRAVAARSRLPVLELNVSDSNVDAAAERVADWLEQTGGLHFADEGPQESRRSQKNPG